MFFSTFKQEGNLNQGIAGNKYENTKLFQLPQFVRSIITSLIAFSEGNVVVLITMKFHSSAVFHPLFKQSVFTIQGLRTGQGGAGPR